MRKHYNIGETVESEVKRLINRAALEVGIMNSVRKDCQWVGWEVQIVSLERCVEKMSSMAFERLFLFVEFPLQLLFKK